ncbi:hypothetical protein CC86DRAFT_402766 [Ophiobolus disseminans]|uniref:Uncharacterized protein n=1 Tax=Ophiobolus disseminans TaxID=1469910 RepID=A0A6A7ADI8_9PLEO|nr:hypothetical protein CC86DRAFT_402766 [Ophiobolus disseminans]
MSSTQNPMRIEAERKIKWKLNDCNNRCGQLGLATLCIPPNRMADHIKAVEQRIFDDAQDTEEYEDAVDDVEKWLEEDCFEDGAHDVDDWVVFLAKYFPDEGYHKPEPGDLPQNDLSAPPCGASEPLPPPDEHEDLGIAENPTLPKKVVSVKVSKDDGAGEALFDPGVHRHEEEVARMIAESARLRQEKADKQAADARESSMERFFAMVQGMYTLDVLALRLHQSRRTWMTRRRSEEPAALSSTHGNVHVEQYAPPFVLLPGLTALPPQTALPQLSAPAVATHSATENADVDMQEQQAPAIVSLPGLMSTQPQTASPQPATSAVAKSSSSPDVDMQEQPPIAIQALSELLSSIRVSSQHAAPAIAKTPLANGNGDVDMQEQSAPAVMSLPELMSIVNSSSKPVAPLLPQPVASFPGLMSYEGASPNSAASSVPVDSEPVLAKDDVEMDVVGQPTMNVETVLAAFSGTSGAGSSSIPPHLHPYSPPAPGSSSMLPHHARRTRDPRSPRTPQSPNAANPLSGGMWNAPRLLQLGRGEPAKKSEAATFSTPFKFGGGINGFGGTQDSTAPVAARASGPEEGKKSEGLESAAGMKTSTVFNFASNSMTSTASVVEGNQGSSKTSHKDTDGTPKPFGPGSLAPAGLIIDQTSIAAIPIASSVKEAKPLVSASKAKVTSSSSGSILSGILSLAKGADSKASTTPAKPSKPAKAASELTKATVKKFEPVHVEDKPVQTPDSLEKVVVVAPTLASPKQVTAKGEHVSLAKEAGHDTAAVAVEKPVNAGGEKHDTSKPAVGAEQKPLKKEEVDVAPVETKSEGKKADIIEPVTIVEENSLPVTEEAGITKNIPANTNPVAIPPSEVSTKDAQTTPPPATMAAPSHSEKLDQILATMLEMKKDNAAKDLRHEQDKAALELRLQQIIDAHKQAMEDMEARWLAKIDELKKVPSLCEQSVQSDLDAVAREHALAAEAAEKETLERQEREREDAAREQRMKEDLEVQKLAQEKKVNEDLEKQKIAHEARIKADHEALAERERETAARQEAVRKAEQELVKKEAAFKRDAIAQAEAAVAREATAQAERDAKSQAEAAAAAAEREDARCQVEQERESKEASEVRAEQDTIAQVTPLSAPGHLQDTTTSSTAPTPTLLSELTSLLSQADISESDLHTRATNLATILIFTP